MKPQSLRLNYNNFEPLTCRQIAQRHQDLTKLLQITGRRVQLLPERHLIILQVKLAQLYRLLTQKRLLTRLHIHHKHMQKQLFTRYQILHDCPREFGLNIADIGQENGLGLLGILSGLEPCYEVDLEMNLNVLKDI